MAHEVAARDHDQGGNEHVVLKAHGQAAALLDAVEERRAAQVAVRPRAWHDVFAALPRVIVTDRVPPPPRCGASCSAASRERADAT